MDGDDAAASLWLKIERSMAVAANEAATGATSPVTEEDRRAKRKRRHRRMLADVIASAFWVYVVTKVFIGDIDVVAGERIGGWLSTLVEYRVFVFVAALVLLAVVAKRSTLLWVLYIIGFPLVVLFWKVPKFYFKRKNWLLVIGTLHVLTGWIRSIKWSLIGGGLFFLAFGAVILLDNSVVLGVAVVVLIAIWGVSLTRAFVTGLQPSRFVEWQRRTADRALGTAFVHEQTAVTPEARDPSVEILSVAQTKTLLTHITSGLIMHRMLLLAVHQLDRYRRSGAFIVFSALSVLALLIQGLLTFGLVNYSLWQIDPSQYDSEPGREPSFIVFVYYALGSMFGNEISLVTPVGGWAIFVFILASISSGIVLLVLVVTLVFSIRKSRTDESSKRAIADFEKAVERVESELSQEYELSVDEAFARLEALEWGSVGLITWLSQQAGRADQEPGLDLK